MGGCHKDIINKKILDKALVRDLEYSIQSEVSYVCNTQNRDFIDQFYKSFS